MSSLDSFNGNFTTDSVEIRQVWDSNLEQELRLIRSIIFDHPFVSLDTEFSSVSDVFDLSKFHNSLTEYNDEHIQRNINQSKLIQLGFTFFDSSGHLPIFGSPPRPSIWQFNFREFNPTSDNWSSNSMYLRHRSNMEIEKNHILGVTAHRFSELFSYGILQNDSLQWITFNSRYDLGYLLKTLTSRDVPHSQEDFHRSLRLYFPKVCDIKHMMKLCKIRGGLKKVAKTVGVNISGNYQEVGLDSLVVAAVFQKFKDNFFHGSVERFIGVLYDESRT